MPKNTISIARPGRYGNPYRIVETGTGLFNVYNGSMLIAWAISKDMALDLSLEKYEEGLNHEEIKKELKGKNVACFCKTTERCHGDILLKIANS